MAQCEKSIAADIQQDCTNPIYTGHEPVGYIINRKDIDTITRTGNVISAITLKTGKHAHHIYQDNKNPFNGSTTAFAEGTVTNKVNKTAAFVVLNDGPDVCEDIIDPALNGEFVVILGRKWSADDGEGKFRVIGSETGARCTACEGNPDSADTDGGWSITLTETNAPSSGVFFFSTSITATITALEALCSSTSDSD